MQDFVKKIQAIDFHAHFGTALRDSSLKSKFMSATPELVLERARKANTELTVVSPLTGLMPRCGADPIKGNEETAKLVSEKKEFMQWVLVDPLKPQTYDQAAQMLLSPRCAGIKIHPEEHGYPVDQFGEAIFSFAAGFKAIVLTHSGDKNSLPEDFVKYADAFPEVTLIIAHHGFCWDGDPTHQVRAIQKSKHGNMFTDTSSASNIMPMQIEWGVKEIGAERVLYGTDTPLYFAPMQRARIDNAEISDEEKKIILRDNALKLLKRLKPVSIGSV